ncbi:MAG: hypothetical protein IJ593_07075 [Lachnospiraceae bacterium]|nr:hypothetical protein [Lachnospiraceae bacterium]
MLKSKWFKYVILAVLVVVLIILLVILVKMSDNNKNNNPVVNDIDNNFMINTRDDNAYINEEKPHEYYPKDSVIKTDGTVLELEEVVIDAGLNDLGNNDLSVLYAEPTYATEDELVDYELASEYVKSLDAEHDIDIVKFTENNIIDYSYQDGITKSLGELFKLQSKYERISYESGPYIRITSFTSDHSRLSVTGNGDNFDNLDVFIYNLDDEDSYKTLNTLLKSTLGDRAVNYAIAFKNDEIPADKNGKLVFDSDMGTVVVEVTESAGTLEFKATRVGTVAEAKCTEYKLNDTIYNELVKEEFIVDNGKKDFRTLDFTPIEEKYGLNKIDVHFADVMQNGCYIYAVSDTFSITISSVDLGSVEIAVNEETLDEAINKMIEILPEIDVYSQDIREHNFGEYEYVAESDDYRILVIYNDYNYKPNYRYGCTIKNR